MKVHSQRVREILTPREFLQELGKAPITLPKRHCMEVGLLDYFLKEGGVGTPKENETLGVATKALGQAFHSRIFWTHGAEAQYVRFEIANSRENSIIFQVIGNNQVGFPAQTSSMS
jgi:hypothetical protein